jgi:hypothetical protein
MHCYLCQSSNFTPRKGKVRDAPRMQIVEYDNCGLVTLSATDHIVPGFYENSGMHGDEPTPMYAWLKETEWDDQRRFDMVRGHSPQSAFAGFRLWCGRVSAAGGKSGCGGYGDRTRNQGARLLGGANQHRAQRRSCGAGVRSHHCLPRYRTSSGPARHDRSLQPNGRMIVEVPRANDALLMLYDCDAFQRFTYWSQHLFLFNASTLEMLARQAKLRVVAVQHYQSYPLSNYLHWLSQGKPGGHLRWAFLDTPELASAYANTLAALGKADTLIAHLERCE